MAPNQAFKLTHYRTDFLGEFRDVLTRTNMAGRQGAAGEMSTIEDL